MDRRDFLKTSGAAAVAAMTASIPSATLARAGGSRAQEPRRVTLLVPWAQRVSGYADEAMRLARRIETVAEGHLSITLAYDWDVSPSADGPDEIRLLPVAHRVATHPGFAYFAGLPGRRALDASALDGWLHHGGGQDLWDELSASSGTKSILAGHSGALPVLWSKRPITGPSDFEGLRVFARGLAAEVARGLGAEVVTARECEAERLAASGALDAVEWGSLEQASALGLPEIYPFGLRGALNRFGSTLGLEFSIPLWNRFDPTVREAIATAALQEFRDGIEDRRTCDAAVLAALRATAKVTLDAAPPHLQDAIDRVAASVVAHAAGRDRCSARIDQSYLMALYGLPAADGRFGMAGV